MTRWRSSRLVVAPILAALLLLVALLMLLHQHFLAASTMTPPRPLPFGKAVFIGQKAGSTSVADAFAKLGYRTQHATDWSKESRCCAKLHGTEVFAGTPWLTTGWFEKFVAAFPQDRDHGRAETRLMVIFLDREFNSHVASYLAHKRNRGLEFAKNASVAHIRRVHARAEVARAWLDAHGIAHTTVDVVKDSADAAAKISAFLDLPAPITLPHSNNAKTGVVASIFRATHSQKGGRVRQTSEGTSRALAHQLQRRWSLKIEGEGDPG